MAEPANYEISTAIQGGILEVTIRGEATPENAEDLHYEVLGGVQSVDSQAILIDVRSIKGRFGVGDSYWRVRTYPRGNQKVAIVDLPENKNFQTFYELVATNVGLSVKCFSDIDSARIWLQQT